MRRRLLPVVVFVFLTLAVTASARIGGGQSYSAPSSSSSAAAASSSSSSSRSKPSYSGPSSSSASSSSTSSGWTPSSSATRSTPSPGAGAGGGGRPARWNSGYAENTGANMIILAIILGSALVAFAIWFLVNRERPGPFARFAKEEVYAPPPRRLRLPSSWGDRGRRIDPRFVEVLFLERVVLLVTHLLEAAPRRELLAALSPYIVEGAAEVLTRRHRTPGDVVVGVVVGHAAIVGIDRTGTTMFIDVELHLNRHLRSTNGTPGSRWSHERWSFVKETGADSVQRGDDVIDRFGCPHCGSPLEEDTRGRCPNCQSTLSAGACDWAVRQIVIHDEQSMGPVLTQDVQEVGTDEPTIVDEAPLDDANRLLGVAGRTALLAFARAVFANLQTSWSKHDLDGIRPFETDALFQSHRCWIEEYKRQGLRNVVGELRLAGVQVCRVQRDGDYLVALLRIGASCTDVTLRADDRVVAGHPQRRRHFTEYWTFVKHKDAEGGAQGGASLTTCPGCGAPLSITQAGICTSCQRKVTLGRFDWVVSRIEQDEEVARTAVH